MNMQVSQGVQPPPPPARLEEMKLPVVMMRDILIKTMFRKNLDMVTELTEAICLPRAVTQELMDMAREQRLVEATGTLNANSGNEMGYQLTDAGKARALDALSQSEYFGAMPVPLEVYREQIKRQSIRNIQISRGELTGAMGHLVLPDSLLDYLGPAVSAGRSILMYGPPGNGKSSISNGIRDAMGDKIYVPRAIEYSGQVITVYDPIVHSKAEVETDDPNSLRRKRTFDTRYVRCERPTVITGGELSLDMLVWSTTPQRAHIRRRYSSNRPAASLSWTTLAVRQNPHKAWSTAGSSHWKNPRIFWHCNLVKNSKSPSTRW